MPRPSTPEEADLYRRARAGDLDAETALLSHIRPLLAAIARRKKLHLSNQVVELDDIVQTMLYQASVAIRTGIEWNPSYNRSMPAFICWIASRRIAEGGQLFDAVFRFNDYRELNAHGVKATNAALIPLDKRVNRNKSDKVINEEDIACVVDIEAHAIGHQGVATPEQEKMVMDTLGLLTYEKHRQVLIMSYGLFGNAALRDFEIETHLGFKPGYVKQLRTALLKKLRQQAAGIRKEPAKK